MNRDAKCDLCHESESVMSMNDLSEADLIEYQKWIVEKEIATYKQLKEGA